jgi:acyl transferase domain-containing protein
MMSNSVLSEPVAVVGIGCLYPQAADKDAFWRQLMSGESQFKPLITQRYWQIDEGLKKQFKEWHCASFDPLNFNYKRFGIPPVFRKSVAQMSLMLLHVVDACLMDAGYVGEQPLGDDVDVICGTCFGFDSTFSNALKVEGMWLAYESGQHVDDTDSFIEELRQKLVERFGVSSHDRVGEMASSIPARIASAFSFRGRAQTIESADATGYVALETAVTALSEGQNSAVIVATGQRMESMLMPVSFKKKGFSGALDGHPFAGDPIGVPLGEGATALLLKRLGDAEENGNRIYGVIDGLSAEMCDSVGGQRYSADVTAKTQAMIRACEQANIDPVKQNFIECVLPGIGGEAGATLETLAKTREFPEATPLILGSSITCFGHTFANATLTAVAAVCLSLYHKSLAPIAVRGRELLPLQGCMEYCRGIADWFGGDQEARVAGVCGSSLNGMSWHMVMRAADRKRYHDIKQSLSLVHVNYAREGRQEPIAVVGMGGAFGPSENSESFWHIVHTQNDAVQKIPETVLPRSVFFSEGTGRPLTSYAQYGADLKQRKFDVSAYRIFPKRSACMDIVQKLALNVAAEALHDYGIEEKRAHLGKAGVFIASNLSLGQERKLVCKVHFHELYSVLCDIIPPPQLKILVAMHEENLQIIDRFTLDGYLASGTAALISNSFLLNAIPITVEAACASSLAVLSDAVQALRQRRYDFIVAGGVELPVNVRDLVLCSSQMMLSREKIAPFTEGADGFSPGDGGGIFVLKRLSDAQRDGDRVYAKITGVGGSCDATSMTAPNVEGQTLAIRRAFEQVEYSPHTVQYIEAHGTGTRLGDISELRAIANVYGGNEREYPLKIGSVKSNIGHTFAASGSAGLLKTLLALKHKVMPATLIRRSLNPELELAEIPAEIINETAVWPSVEGIRRAAVSSFGTGGINYHLLLEVNENEYILEA